MNLAWIAAAVLIFAAVGPPALADNVSDCLSQRMASLENGQEEMMAAAEPAAVGMFNEVLNEVGYETWEVALAPCPNTVSNTGEALMAEAINPDTSNVGRVVAYRPEWFTKEYGDDRWMIKAIFAHEIGHYYFDHFGSSKSSVERESESDKFAGCIISRLGGPLEKAIETFRVIRFATSDKYPTRDESVRLVEEGFNECSDTVQMDEPVIVEEEAPWEAVVPAESQMGYVWLGHFDSGGGFWTKSNFDLGDYSPHDLNGISVLAISTANLRDTISEGSEHVIGSLSAGDYAVVLDTVELHGAYDGQIWGRVDTSN